MSVTRLSPSGHVLGGPKMRFSYDGIWYTLHFAYTRGLPEPSTTAILLSINDKDGSFTVEASATTTAPRLVKDRCRMHALKRLSKGLPKELNQLMWSAYVYRRRRPRAIPFSFPRMRGVRFTPVASSVESFIVG